MSTTLILVRHAATEANLAHPPRLQGCRINPRLARIGIRQAEATRDFLATRTIAACYCSPLARALQTAQIISEPHGLAPVPIDGLIEGDVGRWEGMTWPEVRYFDASEYRAFITDPAAHGYPGGENFRQVYDRVAAAINMIWNRHERATMLVVSHHIVTRVYLAALMGFSISDARQVSLDNCGVSVVTRDDDGTIRLSSLNVIIHLGNVAA